MNKMLYETEEKKLAFLQKKGNIVTFKEPFFPWGMDGESRTQIVVSQIRKDKSGSVKIIGPFYDTGWYKSMNDLLTTIDWQWMERAHRNLPRRKI